MIVDARGRPCPVPVIELAKALPSVPVGSELTVWSDDPASRHDVPAWCRLRGQAYVGSAPLDDDIGGGGGGGAAYTVRRLS